MKNSKVDIPDSVLNKIYHLIGKKCRITQIVDGMYEMEIITPIGWQLSDLSRIISKSLYSVGIQNVKSIKVIDAIEDKSILN